MQSQVSSKQQNEVILCHFFDNHKMCVCGCFSAFFYQKYIPNCRHSSQMEFLNAQDSQFENMKHFYLKGTIKGVYWTTTRHNWPKLVQKAKNEPGIKHNISYFDNISDFQIKHKFILDNGIQTARNANHTHLDRAGFLLGFCGRGDKTFWEGQPPSPPPTTERAG